MVRARMWPGITLGLCMHLAFINNAWSQTQKEVSVNLLGNPIGYIYSARAEISIGNNMSVFAKLAGLSYNYNDGGYYEEGSGSLAGAGLRFFVKENIIGMYFGVGIDYTSGSVYWYDWPLYGTTYFSGIVPNVTIGYKVLFKNRIVLEPNLYLGYLSGQDVELGVIIGLGLALGYRF